MALQSIGRLTSTCLTLRACPSRCRFWSRKPNSCTMGMLLCLDRKQRLVFTLGEILSVSDTVGGEVLEMTADNFRQCLARARRELHNFMTNQCGLVNKSNPCRCPK